jgi:RbcX protein
LFSGRVVIAQLEGMGRGNLAAYNANDIKQLYNFLEENEIRNGDEWLAKLMRKNKMLGGNS